jgi:Holliday junction resolvase RusA-like endonuclease
MVELEACECGSPVLEVVIPGEPVGKARPRFERRGASVRTFTPPKTEAWETRATYLARAAVRGAGWRPDPAATYGAEVRAYRRHAHRGPDLDNVVKAALDALNGEAWTDDARVRELRAVVVQDPEPRVVVRVWRLT